MTLPISKSALQQHAIALGKTRSGKSSKMRVIIEYFLDHDTPVCIIDPKGDWWGLKSSADGKSAGYPIIIFGSEYARHADVRINVHSGAEIGRLVASGNRPCLIDLKGMKVSDRNRFFVAFAEAYFRHAAGKRVLMIDEVHNFAPQGRMLTVEAAESLHWANRLITEGGGMGITVMSASQRPQKVHKDFVSSNETLIACRVIHKRDRDAMKEWVDACGDPDVAKEMLAGLAGMPRTDAWVYSPEAEFGPKRITFPMFSTYDSFQPQGVSQKRLKGWADVDLAEVQAQIAKTIEEHKANDPKALKAEIARLTAELAKKPAVAIDQDALDKIRAEFARANQQRGELVRRTIAKMAEHTIKMADGIRSAVESADVEIAKAYESQSVLPTVSGKVTVDPPTRGSSVFPAKSIRLPSPGVGGDGSISPTTRKILDAIHRAHPVALSFETAAARAAVSRRSSAYEKYRKEVDASSEVQRRDDGKFVSAPGFSTPVGPGVDPIAEFASRLPPTYAGMLRAIANSVVPLQKEVIATIAAVSPTSSGLSSGLGELIKLGLIQKNGDSYQLHEDLAQ